MPAARKPSRSYRWIATGLERRTSSVKRASSSSTRAYSSASSCRGQPHALAVEVDGHVHHVPDGVVARADQVADQPLARPRLASTRSRARQMPGLLGQLEHEHRQRPRRRKDAALDRDHFGQIGIGQRADLARRARRPRSAPQLGDDERSVTLRRPPSAPARRRRASVGIRRAPVVGQDLLVGLDRPRRTRAQLADRARVDQVQRRGVCGDLHARLARAARRSAPRRRRPRASCCARRARRAARCSLDDARELRGATGASRARSPARALAGIAAPAC